MDTTYGANGEGHLWVAIDPGITTGWALLADDATILGHGVFSENDIYSGLDALIRGCHRAGKSLSAVVEKMPGTGAMSDLQQRLERVRGIITELVEECYELPVTYVAPGEWKTSRVARTAKHPDAKTQHEIDASLLGLYAIGKAMKSGH